MTNPWLKSNPFLSMWLSGANTVAAYQRQQFEAAAARYQADAARQWIEVWTNAWLARLPDRK